MNYTTQMDAAKKGLTTKINVNLGISQDCANAEKELDKVRLALEMKTDAIMDLSNYGKTEHLRKQVIEMSTAMIGTVPMYDAIGFNDKELKDLTVDDFFRVVEKHGKDSVDFITVHAGMNLETAKVIRKNPRLTNIVSRGGSLLFEWMELNKKEHSRTTSYRYSARL